MTSIEDIEARITQAQIVPAADKKAEANRKAAAIQYDQTPMAAERASWARETEIESSGVIADLSADAVSPQGEA